MEEYYFGKEFITLTAAMELENEQAAKDAFQVEPRPIPDGL